VRRINSLQLLSELNTIIRSAKPDDLSGILALYSELRPNDPDLTEDAARTLLSRIIDDPALELIVCECEHVLVSTCMLAIVTSLASGGRPFGVIEHVVTLSQFRRRGLGRATLQFALDLAWTRGCYKVILLSGVQRTEAHSLYESLGFKGDVERGFVAKPRESF
jgi:GNAT superfamily N-acetyltransferase